MVSFSPALGAEPQLEPIGHAAAAPQCSVQYPPRYVALPVEVKCLQKAPGAMLEKSTSVLQAAPTRPVATGVHFCETQLSPEAQVAHALPNEPHALIRLPGWQKPNWQQPIGHVVGLQPWQLPLRHCEPAGH